MTTPANGPVPRGQCRRCAREFVVRADGMIRTHDQPTIRFPNGQTLPGPTCPGSGRLPAVPPIVCTGRTFDADTQPIGPPCGRRLEAHDDEPLPWPVNTVINAPTPETAGQLATRARLSGWKIASDGTGNALCPACAKPDPVTVGLCRDLARSVRR